MLSLSDYESVLAVAEERHFARAARRLGITQPALTARLRRIEDEIGTPLFIRGRSGVTPTDAGTAFLDGAQRVLDTAAATASAARSAASGLGAVLRIGITQIAADQIVVPCLSAFRRAHPDARVLLSEGTTAGLERALEQSAVDVAFIHPPLHAPGLSQRTLHSVALVQHNFNADGANRPAVRYPRHEAPVLMGEFERQMSDETEKFTPMEADTAIGAMVLSMAGYGTAILPAGYRALGTEAGATENDDLVLETCLAWRSLDRRPVLRTFIDLAVAATAST